MRKLIAIAAFFIVSTGAFAQKNVATSTKTTPVAVKAIPEEEKINLLIKYIANLQGATFIRNGDEYPAKDAAEHLQMKRRKAGSKVKTARDFIDGLASESYISGKAYQIRFKDGKTYYSRDVLMKELARIEKQN